MPSGKCKPERFHTQKHSHAPKDRQSRTLATLSENQNCVYDVWTCKEVQPLWKSSEAGPPVARRSCCVTQLSHPKALKTCLHVRDHQSSVTHESQKAEYPKSVTTIPRHVCYSATRKEWNSDICQMSLENIMLREQKKKSDTKATPGIRFHSYEMCRAGERAHRDRKGRTVARAVGREDGRPSLRGFLRGA